MSPFRRMARVRARGLIRACSLALVGLAGVWPGPAARAQVRLITLQGDAAPGVPGATFTAFPPSVAATGYSTWPVCDASGHAAFYATTSTGVNGLWTDDLGSLAPLALVGGTAPWFPGSGTFQSMGQPMLADGGPAAFLGVAVVGSPLNGIWYQDGSGLALAAGDGVTAPYISGNTTFLIQTDAGKMCLSRDGHLAIRGGPASNILWSFDPPPVVNRYFCAATGSPVPTGSFTSFGAISFNIHGQYGLHLGYWNGSAGVSWMGEGACGLLAPVLADGDLAPPSRVDIPSISNVAQVANSQGQPDLNGSNAVVFRSKLVNGGVTSADDDVVWLHDGTGFHVVLREGDTAPELAAGETLVPWDVSSHPDLVSDGGSVVLAAKIQPSATYALLFYRADRGLHVLARDNGGGTGAAGRSFGLQYTGAPAEGGFALNRYGQVLLQCWTRDSLDPTNLTRFQNWIYMTDAAGTLRPVLRSGDTLTVRAGLTGRVYCDLNFTLVLPSNGSDGRVRDFSDAGEYIFRGQFLPNGSGTALAAMFAVKGPDLAALAGAPDEPPPVETRLEPVTPNPTAGAMAVAFDLAHAGAVRLEVFDAAGRHMRTLRTGELAAGRHVERWVGDDDTGRPLPHGLYFVRLRGPGTTAIRRVVMVR